MYAASMKRVYCAFRFARCTVAAEEQDAAEAFRLALLESRTFKRRLPRRCSEFEHVRSLPPPYKDLNPLSVLLATSALMAQTSTAT